MADLIERGYLIGKFEDTGQPAVSEMGKGYDLGIAAALRVVKNAPAVNRWIPCSERMPAEWQIVAAYGEKIGLKCVEWHPEMGVFIDTQSEYDEQIKPEYFTRWIPLPEEGDNDA